MATKPRRPRAGLGLSSAITTEQLTIRTVRRLKDCKPCTPTTRKPRLVRSCKPQRIKPDKH